MLSLYGPRYRSTSYTPRLWADSFFNYTYPEAKQSAWSKGEDGSYSLVLNIPGYGKEDVSVKVIEKTLKIEVSDAYRYTYTLPDEYDLQKASASVDKGVLRVSVPVRESEVATEIEIRVD